MRLVIMVSLEDHIHTTSITSGQSIIIVLSSNLANPTTRYLGGNPLTLHTTYPISDPASLDARIEGCTAFIDARQGTKIALAVA